MARRCTTVPGFGVCCRAAQQNLIGRPFQFNDSRGTARCAECTIERSQSKDPRKNGRQIFRFRFHKNQECGIGPGGCPALAGGQQQIGGGQGGITLQP